MKSLRNLALLFSLLLLLPGTSFSIGLTPLDSLLSTGYVTDVAVQGDTWFLAAQDQGVLVAQRQGDGHFDVVAQMGDPTMGGVNYLAVWGDRLVAVGDQVQLFDVSDPAAPAWLDADEPAGFFHSSTWLGRNLHVWEDDTCILQAADQVLFYTVSDADELVLEHMIEFDVHDFMISTMRRGSTLYLLHSGREDSFMGQLWKVDMATLDDPVLEPIELNPDENLLNVSLYGDSALAVNDDRIRLYDISDDQNPVERWSWENAPDNWILHAEFLSPTVVLYSTWVSGELYTLDVSGDVPMPLDTLHTGGNTLSAELDLGDNQRVFTLFGEGLFGVDVADAAHPFLEWAWRLTRHFGNLGAYGPTLLMETTTGLGVIDMRVRDQIALQDTLLPSLFRTLGFYEQSGHRLFGLPQLRYSSEDPGYRSVITIANPEAMEVAIGDTARIQANHAAFYSNALYAIDASGGPSVPAESLKVYDISDPDHPAFVRSVSPPPLDDRSLVAVEHIGSMLFVGAQIGGPVNPTYELYGFNISDPLNPVYVPSVRDAGAPGGFILMGAGNRLYIDTGGGVAVCDVSTPWYPVLMGTVAPLHGSGVLLDWYGDIVAMRSVFDNPDTHGGLEIWDTATPEEPQLLAEATFPTRVTDAVLDDDRVWVTWGYGMHLFQVDGVGVEPGEEPARPETPWLSVYPNPANPAATIRVLLERPGRLQVTVVDVLGREVARLADDLYPPGIQRLRFDGSGLASGTYLVRASGPSGVRERKVVLLK